MRFILGLLLLSLFGRPGKKEIHQKTKAGTRYIIDTDAGPDDMMAISLLLTKKNISIEAITVVNGVAHVSKGAENIEKLLTLSHHQNIPVYIGQSRPMSGHNAFPRSWRTAADQFPGVDLPDKFMSPAKENAVTFLQKVLLNAKHPIVIIALGPLTNIAKVIQGNPETLQNIDKIIVMGGAYNVPGNVMNSDEAGTAEWNFYIDPKATNIVFESGAPIVQIPLDATNQVPINKSFLNQFNELKHNALGRITYQILEGQKSMIDNGDYYAWDPLAAASVIEPGVIQTKNITVKTRIGKKGAGEIYETPYSPFKVSVAFNANEKMFKKLFFSSFSIP